MTQATLAQCNSQLQASWDAAPVIGKTLTGTGEPEPTVGSIGDLYFRKSDSTLYGPKTNSGWGTPVSFKGATGDPGVDGKTILNGATGPTAGAGATGDFYIDTTAHEIYGPKGAGGWGTGTSLVGGG